MSRRKPEREIPIPLRDAADYSGLSVHVLRKHIHEGTLTATRNGNRYEVAIADLDALPAKLEQIRRDRKEAERKAQSEAISAAAQKAVEGWPPFSEEQKKRLGVILGGAPAPRPPIIPVIPVTESVIHPRPKQPTHVHCGECGKTWKVPSLEAHLTYDKAVAHGEKKHPEVDARLNVKPGRGPALEKEHAELRAWAKQKAAEAPPMSAEQADLVIGVFRDALRNRK